MPRRRHAAVVVLVAAAATAFATSPAGAAAGSHAADSIAAGSTAPATSISTAHAAPAPSAPTGSASPTPAYRSYTAKSKGVAPRSQDAITVKGNIFYVANNGNGNRCAGETGDGSWARPFCEIQSAVNAAAPGDTISVTASAHGGPALFAGPVTITKSNLTIAGTNAGPIMVQGAQQALTISGATGVKISGLALQGTVSVTGSSDVTLDADYLVAPILPSETGGDAVHIDGASSDVTVSRSLISVQDGQYVPGGIGVRMAAGAKNVTIASDIFSHLDGGAVQAAGANGLDVVGDTIQRACGGALSVSGGSTGVALENNVIEDAFPGNGSFGYKSDCISQDPLGWAPDVTVAADSVAGTTADYNDFYVYGTDATALYDWNGTSYTALADFQAAANQGAHDVGDSAAEGSMPAIPGGDEFVDAVPRAGSAAVGSANPQAPGALSTDFYGIAPYRERGAIALGDTPVVTQLVANQWDAQSAEVTAASSRSARPAYRYLFNWGDGQTDSSAAPTVTHRYAQVGTYSISVTVLDGLGNQATATVPDFVTAGSDFTPYGPTRLLDTRYGTGTDGARIPVPAFGTIKLKVAGTGSIPASAKAVALNVTATAPTASGYITVFPNNAPRPITSVINFSPGTTSATMTVSEIGADGEVELYNGSGGTVHLIADVSGYFAPAASNAYESVSPVRILDTKTGVGGYAGSTVTQGRPVVLRIGGAQGVPSGAKAVAVNITVANPTQGGYLTAFPHLQAQPTVSNIDFAKGETRANAAIVPIGSDGDIELALTTSGAARLIVDVDGVFVPGANGGAAYAPVVPYRYFDTRLNDPTGLPGFFFECLPLAQKGGQLNPLDAGYVLNVTAINPGTSGYMTVYPDGSFGCADSPGIIPNTSTLDFAGHQTVPNMAIVSPGDFGDVDFLNGSGASLQFAVDVYGVFLND